MLDIRWMSIVMEEYRYLLQHYKQARILPKQKSIKAHLDKNGKIKSAPHRLGYDIIDSTAEVRKAKEVNIRAARAAFIEVYTILKAHICMIALTYKWWFAICRSLNIVFRLKNRGIFPAYEVIAEIALCLAAFVRTERLYQTTCSSLDVPKAMGSTAVPLAKRFYVTSPHRRTAL